MKHRRFWGDRAAGVVIQRASDGKVLLVHRDGVEGDGWGFPGGKIDEGDDVQDTLRNEMREELGSIPKGRLTGKTWTYRTAMNVGDYRVDLGEEVEAEGETFEYSFHHYVCEDTTWEPRLNWEHDKHGWFDRDKLPNGLYKAKDEHGRVVHTVKTAVQKLTTPVDRLSEAVSDELLDEKYWASPRSVGFYAGAYRGDDERATVAEWTGTTWRFFGGAKANRWKTWSFTPMVKIDIEAMIA